MEVIHKMAPEPLHPKEEPRGEPVPDFQQALSNLSNPELLSALDLALLELEKQLFRDAKVGPELPEMADEGLVLAARAKARLAQSLSAAQHTCRWWGLASGSPLARVLRGTQSPDLLMRTKKTLRLVTQHPSTLHQRALNVPVARSASPACASQSALPLPPRARSPADALGQRTLDQ